MTDADKDMLDRVIRNFENFISSLASIEQSVDNVQDMQKDMQKSVDELKYLKDNLANLKASILELKDIVGSRIEKSEQTNLSNLKDGIIELKDIVGSRIEKSEQTNFWIKLFGGLITFFVALLGVATVVLRVLFK